MVANMSQRICPAIVKNEDEIEWIILVNVIFSIVGPFGNLFGLIALFNGISTFVGYLMPKPFF